MKFSALISGTPLVATNAVDTEVSAVVTDSRAVTPGALFFAREGWFVDSHAFLGSAAEAGASAFVVTRPDTVDQLAEFPVAVSEKEDRDLGLICDRFFGEPTMGMKVYGVTGTNGKTSTTFLLAHMLRAIGERPAIIGTVTHRFEDLVLDAKNTTPDGLTIHGFARQAADLGATCLLIEVSSHGAELERIAGVAFDVVGFTNLSPDHLDYHGDMASYAAAKALLFGRDLSASADRGKETAAVAWVDDPAGDTMLAAASDANRRLRVGMTGDALDVTIAPKKWLGARGVSFLTSIQDTEITATSTLVGSYNLANVGVAAAMIACTHGAPALSDALGALAHFAGIPGRYEAPYAVDEVPTTFVDYAHSPDAVARATDVLVGLDDRPTTVVLGCGGDRDRTKRGPMAVAALSRAERVILTADNPRSEAADAIIDEMVEGAGTLADKAEVIVDRSEAIDAAVRSARGPVLIAGKGHETYQERTHQGRVTRFHFDDREEARRACRGRLVGTSSMHTPIVSGWSAERLASAVGGTLRGTPSRRPLGAICTDSRKLKRDDVFFALVGDRFDGHKFVETTLAAGAAVAIVQRGRLASIGVDGGATIEVDDTGVALQRLATAILKEARSRIGGLRTLAITGSNGKTTTKEMAAALLGDAALVTPGNFNNHIGLPLTVAGLTPSHRYAVLEMGANGPNDIKELAAIAEPNVGVITSIGMAHIEGFGDLDGVRAAKVGIGAAGLETVVLPADLVSFFPPVYTPKEGVVTFGADQASCIVDRDDAFGPVTIGGREVALSLPGFHNATNLAAAVLGVEALTGQTLSQDQIHEAMAQLSLPDGRLRQLEMVGRTVIDDAYNANPASMKASLALLATRSSPRIAVLGEMRELGPESDAYHAEIGAVAQASADLVVVVGEGARAMAVGETAFFADVDTAAAFVVNAAPAGATVLLKGSRGARLERLIPLLRNAWEG